MEKKDCGNARRLNNWIVKFTILQYLMLEANEKMDIDMDMDMEIEQISSMLVNLRNVHTYVEEQQRAQ